MKEKERMKVQGGSWFIDLIDKLHPDYKDFHAEAVETKTMVDDEVVTRYRILIHEKDGTTSFAGDKNGPFLYPTMTLAIRDVNTFKKWQENKL